MQNTTYIDLMTRWHGFHGYRWSRIVFVKRPKKMYGISQYFPDNKVHVANMGPTWGLSAPDWPYVGPMNLVIRFVPLISVTEWEEYCRVEVFVWAYSSSRQCVGGVYYNTSQSSAFSSSWKLFLKHTFIVRKKNPINRNAIPMLKTNLSQVICLKCTLLFVC